MGSLKCTEMCEIGDHASAAVIKKCFFGPLVAKIGFFGIFLPPGEWGKETELVMLSYNTH